MQWLQRAALVVNKVNSTTNLDGREHLTISIIRSFRKTGVKLALLHAKAKKMKFISFTH